MGMRTIRSWVREGERAEKRMIKEMDTGPAEMGMARGTTATEPTDLPDSEPAPPG